MTGIRTALMAAAAAALLSAAAAADEGVQVTSLRVDYDQSTLLHLDRPAKTVIVGNATVADAQLVNERTIYVLGRMFGNTNIVAVDATGAEVINTRVTVRAPQFAQVTVYRGPNGQRNLACAPQCERTITQGDSDMQAMYQDVDKKVDISQKSASLSGK